MIKIFADLFLFDRNDIIKLIDENRIVIIKGETGCGKSIRVPQYILEGWSRNGALDNKPCKIIVTQPRRIAAISLAERVAFERDEQVNYCKLNIEVFCNYVNLEYKLDL